MAAKFEPAFVYTDTDPDFEYLVCLSGALIPLAHIKLIGEVQQGFGFMEDEKGGVTPMWSFPVMLTDSDFETRGRDKLNPQIVFDSWDTVEEAEDQRRNLSMQLDRYYKRLLGRK